MDSTSVDPALLSVRFDFGLCRVFVRETEISMRIKVEGLDSRSKSFVAKFTDVMQVLQKSLRKGKDVQESMNRFDR